MAKISTYPSDNNVTVSDKLIGTDAESNKATKNYLVGDILAVANDPNVLTAFVPYTGAISNVNLGVNDLAVNNIQVADSIQAVNQISAATLDADLVEVYQELRITTGAVIDLDGNKGSSGDIMISQGLLNNPIWETQATLFSGLVPYTGATGDLNLGSNNLKANAIYEGGNKLTSYAQAFSLVNQTQTSVGFAKIIEFETGSFSDTATIVSNLITFNAIGKYMIEVTARVEHTSGGGDAVLNLWLQYTTGAVPLTRQTFTVPNTHTQEIKYSFMISIGNPADAIRAYWSTSNLAARFAGTFAGGIYPAAPSTILNVYKIG